jgi:hypothetical protein
VAAVVAWGRIVFLRPSGAPAGPPTSPPTGPRWALLASHAGADLGTVDALAHALLVARRLGGTLRIEHMTGDLADLLDLAGLRREVGGEPEGGEEIGVEEGMESGDPLA